MNAIRSTAAHAAVALAVTACGPASTFEAATAEELAAGAEQLAGHLASESGCEALEQADLLLTRAREGETAGDVPTDVVERIEHVAARVHREVRCRPADTDAGTTGQPEDVAEPAPPQDEDNGKDDTKDNGKDKNNGKDKDNGKSKGKG